MPEITFSDLSFTSDELESLSADEFSILVALAAVVDELRVFQTLLALTETELSSSELVRNAHRVQVFVLFRTYVSKIIETEKLIGKSESQLRKSNSDLSSVFDHRRNDLRELRNSPFFKLSEKFRNKASSHYDLQSIKRGLEGISERGPITANLNQIRGNSIYSFGDAFMNFSVLYGLYASDEEILDAYNRIGEWKAWGMHFSTVATELLELLLLEILDKKFPEKQIEERRHSCDAKFCYRTSDALPLFFVD